MSRDVLHVLSLPVYDLFTQFMNYSRTSLLYSVLSAYSWPELIEVRLTHGPKKQALVPYI